MELLVSWLDLRISSSKYNKHYRDKVPQFDLCKQADGVNTKQDILQYILSANKH